MNGDLYEFMRLGHRVMHAFEQCHPGTEELDSLAAYVGIATTLACNALAPNESYESVVAGYWERSKREAESCTGQVRH